MTRGDDGGHRSQQVAHDVEEGAARVEIVVVATAAGEDPGGDRVGDQSGDGDDQQQAALDLRRLLQALPGLPEDVDGDDDEGDGVDERGQDLRPQVAKGALRPGGTVRQPDGEECQPQGADVGEHVRRVGQQRQRVREIGAGHFDEEEDRGDREGDDQWPAVDAGGGAVDPCLVAAVGPVVVFLMVLVCKLGPGGLGRITGSRHGVIPHAVMIEPRRDRRFAGQAATR